MGRESAQQKYPSSGPPVHRGTGALTSQDKPRRKARFDGRGYFAALLSALRFFLRMLRTVSLGWAPLLIQ
jgi:hypothetical protein